MASAPSPADSLGDIGVNRGTHVYHGGCHCGAVRFRMLGPEALCVIDCNCSICAKTGYLHVTVPHAAFELLAGHEHLAEYRFNSGQARHLFCRVCGIKCHYQPRSHPDCYSVNLRCIDNGADHIGQLLRFDGSNWEQAASDLVAVREALKPST